MTFTGYLPPSVGVGGNPDAIEIERASFPGAWVVQLATGDPGRPDAAVTTLHPATVRLTDARVAAVTGPTEWSWLLGDLEDVFHGGDQPWTILSTSYEAQRRTAGCVRRRSPSLQLPRRAPDCGSDQLSGAIASACGVTAGAPQYGLVAQQVDPDVSPVDAGAGSAVPL